MTDGEKALQEKMASEAMRETHFLWHTLRDWWERFDPEVQDEIRTEFGDAWVPRPSKDADGAVKYDGGAGKDFLGMHRQMILNANEMLVEEFEESPLEGFASPPDVGDTSIPVPVEYFEPITSEYDAKLDDVWKDLRDTELAWLDSLAPDTTIDEFGARIEYGIHNAMHIRFGDYSTNGRLRMDTTKLSVPTEEKYLTVEYDTLLDTFAAHVNPLFWKIHVWIDNQIKKWETATGNTFTMDDVWHGPMDHDAIMMPTPRGHMRKKVTGGPPRTSRPEINPAKLKRIRRLRRILERRTGTLTIRTSRQIPGSSA